jgi:drug/metabolite transporter (DMT)-like permease
MKRDLMRGGLAWALLAGLFAAGWQLLGHEVPQSNRDMVIYMLGQLSGFVGTALAFYFSTSKSSAEKSATIDRLTKGDE